MSETFQPLTGPDDPRVVTFLEAWHENGRPFWHYGNLDYDETERKSAVGGRKYICLNGGDSGCMMVDKGTGEVWGIKAYRKVHKGRFCGHLEELAAKYQEATEHAKRHLTSQPCYY